MRMPTVTLRFTAKPGLYPPQKGGQTWLHERSGPKKVAHEGAPGGFTTKVTPKVVIQSGETFEVEAEMAKTLIARQPECFTLVTPAAPARSRTHGDA